MLQGRKTFLSEENMEITFFSFSLKDLEDHEGFLLFYIYHGCCFIFIMVNAGQHYCTLICINLMISREKNNSLAVFCSDKAYHVSIIVANGNTVQVHKHAITSLCYL